MTASEYPFLQTIKESVQKRLSDSLWIKLTPRGIFPEGMGDRISKIIYRRSTVPDCSAEAWGEENKEQLVQFATEMRQYQLQQSAVQSPSFCFNDIRFVSESEKEQQLEQVGRILSENMRWLHENWIRDKYIVNCGNKVSLTNLDAHKCETTGVGEELPHPPKLYMHQGFLNAFYLQLARSAAEGYYGKCDGCKLFAFIGSPEVLNNLKIQNSDSRQDLRFSSCQNDDLRSLGAGDWSYMNYYLLYDTQAPRYKIKGWFWNRKLVRVPYYSTSHSASGTTAIINREYTDAPVEMAFIFNPEVQTVRFPKSINGEVNEYGDLQLIDDRDEEGNPTGAKRVYILCMQGAEPRRTEWGYAILFRRLTPWQSFKRWAKRLLDNATSLQ